MMKGMTNMKIVDTLWFTANRGYCGLVLCEDEITGERKAYIGRCVGLNPEQDIDDILHWGARFHKGTAERILMFLRENDE